MGRLVPCVPGVDRPQKVEVMLQIASGKLFANKPAQRNEPRVGYRMAKGDETGP